MSIFGMNPISPADMIGRLESYLQTAAQITPDCCFLSLASDEDHLKMPPNDTFVTIFPARFPPWQSVVSGSGGSGEDANLGFDAAIRTTVYSRILNDQEHRSSQTLRDTSYGILKAVTQVVNALQFWTAPLDDDPDSHYLREPMRITGSGPEFVNKRTQTATWALCWIVWEMRFSVRIH